VKTNVSLFYNMIFPLTPLSTRVPNRLKNEILLQNQVIETLKHAGLKSPPQTEPGFRYHFPLVMNKTMSSSSLSSSSFNKKKKKQFNDWKADIEPFDVARFYNQESARIVISHYIDDYIAFKIPLPQWALKLVGYDFVQSLGIDISSQQHSKTQDFHPHHHNNHNNFNNNNNNRKKPVNHWSTSLETDGSLISNKWKEEENKMNDDEITLDSFSQNVENKQYDVNDDDNNNEKNVNVGDDDFDHGFHRQKNKVRITPPFQNNEPHQRGQRHRRQGGTEAFIRAQKRQKDRPSRETTLQRAQHYRCKLAEAGGNVGIDWESDKCQKALAIKPVKDLSHY